MIKVIGCGAAGCSAVIEAYEENVIDINDFLLLNTTDADIPEQYKSKSYLVNKIPNPNPTSKENLYIERRGAGKERDIAKDICLYYFQNDNGSEFNLINELSSMFEATNNIEEDIAVIVTSTEGGSGSGLSIHVASFLKTMGVNIIIVPITGFEKDGRSLKNTFDFFRDMNPEYVICPISNKKFLYGSNNYPKAEKDANIEFAKRLSVIKGNHRRKSSCNKEIDDTDQFKSVTTPGIMDIIYVDLSEVKNIKQFNETINFAIDDSKGLDNSNPQEKKLSIYYNITEAKKSMIDFNASVIKERLGDVYELFEHIQEPIVEDPEESKDYMWIISSGMNLPIDEIKSTYDKFNDRIKSINTKIDGYTAINSMVAETNNVFDMGRKKTINTESSIQNTATDARAKFLKNLGKDVGNDTAIGTGFKNVKKNEDFKV